MSSFRLRGGRVVDPTQAEPTACATSSCATAASSRRSGEHVDAGDRRQRLRRDGRRHRHAHPHRRRQGQPRAPADGRRPPRRRQPVRAAEQPARARLLRHLHAGHAGHRLPLCRDGLHRGLRAGDGAEQRAPCAHGDGRRADPRPRRLRDARQRRAVPATAGRRRRRRAELRADPRLHRLDHPRQQGDGREGRQPGRHLGLQVQPAQARRRRERTCTGRSRRARWCTRWRAR